MVDSGAANACVAYTIFNIVLKFILSTRSQFLKYEFPGSSSDSTNSANSSEAEEEEFYMTGAEFLDEIQQYDQE